MAVSRRVGYGVLRSDAIHYDPGEAAEGAMPRDGLQRELLTELVGDLARRQGETVWRVERSMREADGRFAAAERRHADMADRLERISARIERVGGRLAALQVELRGLRAAPRRGDPRQHVRLPDVDVPAGHASAQSSEARGQVLLRVEHLSKEIGGADILSDINFEIYANEILGLIGPNGAGKTTLMECLANLRPRSSGTFYEGDVAPPDWNPRRLMFYLPNGMTPYAELYTIDVLSLFGRMFEVSPTAGSTSSSPSCRLAPCSRRRSARCRKATCSACSSRWR